MTEQRIRVDRFLLEEVAGLLDTLNGSSRVMEAIGMGATEGLAYKADKLRDAVIRGVVELREEPARPLPAALPFQPRESVVLAALYAFPKLGAQEVARRCEFTGEPAPLVQAVNTLEELQRRGLVVRVPGNSWDLHPVIREVLTLGRLLQDVGLEGVRRKASEVQP